MTCQCKVFLQTRIYGAEPPGDWATINMELCLHYMPFSFENEQFHEMCQYIMLVFVLGHSHAVGRCLGEKGKLEFLHIMLFLSYYKSSILDM